MNRAEPTRDREMPFLEHLRELRRRLAWCVLGAAAGSVLGIVFYPDYIPWLIAPFGEELILRQIEQGFVLRLKVGMYAGLILAFPLAVYHVVVFVLPALTGRERRLLGWLLGSSLLLLGAGGAIGYRYILPVSIAFLKSRDFLPPGTRLLLDYESSLMFVLQVILAFLALFQLPLVLLVLLAAGVLRRRWLWRMQRYVIVVVFIVAAILTPPDVASQIGLALPLILLYYLTILVAKILHFGEDRPAPS